jgi:hypothetical protein
MKGQRYRNKHNDREVTIMESEMMDTGDMIYRCCDDDTGKIDWMGDYTLKEHWVELCFGSYARAPDSLAIDQFVYSEITEAYAEDRQRLLDEICSLKAALKLALDPTLYNAGANDACDTHSQTINTSDGEE